MAVGLGDTSKKRRYVFWNNGSLGYGMTQKSFEASQLQPEIKNRCCGFHTRRSSADKRKNCHDSELCASAVVDINKRSAKRCNCIWGIQHLEVCRTVPIMAKFWLVKPSEKRNKHDRVTSLLPETRKYQVSAIW